MAETIELLEKVLVSEASVGTRSGGASCGFEEEVQAVYLGTVN